MREWRLNVGAEATGGGPERVNSVVNVVGVFECDECLTQNLNTDVDEARPVSEATTIIANAWHDVRVATSVCQRHISTNIANVFNAISLILVQNVEAGRVSKHWSKRDVAARVNANVNEWHRLCIKVVRPQGVCIVHF
jgi:hypothetical protein